MNLQFFGEESFYYFKKFPLMGLVFFLGTVSSFVHAQVEVDRDAGVPLPAGMRHEIVDTRPPELVNLRILHTNDIHSQFHPEASPYNLGGLARLATAIRRARAQVNHSLLLDGGDWSEGKIYYRVDGGRASLEMMNALGYDAAVLGNHDWLNGPEQLLDILRQTPPQFALLGANLTFRAPVDRGPAFAEKMRELQLKVLPYTIRQVGPMKVGIIGICTYEYIYDQYFEPVKIEFPFPVVNERARQLKREQNVDIVIVISHNSLDTNTEIAINPFVDVVIHAHDHMKLNQPKIIPHTPENALQNPFALVVEAGQWGRYLGILDLQFDVNTRRLYGITSPTPTDNFRYRLYQIDDTTPPDPTIESMLRNYDAFIENLMVSDRLPENQRVPNVFHDEIAHTTIGIDSASGGYEPIYGNLLADAYREYTHADIAFEQINLTSGAFFIGAIHTADVINALGQIFNPRTFQAWHLSTMKMTGQAVEELISFLFFLRSIVPSAIPNVSGLHVLHNPAVLSGEQTIRPFDNGQASWRNHGIVSIEVGGVPIEPDVQYTVALSQGLVDTLDFMGKKFRYTIEKTELRDVQVESWRVLRQYLRNHSPISAQTVNLGDRYQSLQPDLAIYSHDITLAETATGTIEADVIIHNYGGTTSRPRRFLMGVDATPPDTTDDPNPLYLTQTQTVPSLRAGASHHMRTQFILPTHFARSRKFPVYVKMNSRYTDRNLDDQNASNDLASVIFVREPARFRAQSVPLPLRRSSQR